jgi:biotin carboxyl carrier protein
MNTKSMKAIFSSGNEIDIDSNSSFRVLEDNGDQLVAEYKNTIYNINIQSFDPQTKSYTLTINDVPTQLSLKNGLDQLIDKLGLKSMKEEDVSQVLAPMPGLVIDISVSVGDEVKKDDPLIVLEAMKMENVLKSKGQGIVKAIHITKQEKVDKSQLLIEFE